MSNVHAKHVVDLCPIRRSSSALLCLAISCMLTACGGGAEQAVDGGSSGGAAIACVTGGTSAILTWNAITTDPDLAGYRIYYGTAPGMYLQLRGSGLPVAANVTTQTVGGLTSGTTYYFAITAYGFTQPESDFSNEVCKTIS
jgi:hypothetical protein